MLRRLSRPFRGLRRALRRLRPRPFQAAVRVTCPRCGPVSVLMQDADMTVRSWTVAWPTIYSFTCKQCGLAVAWEADPEVVEALVGAGAKFIVSDPPAELFEERPDGPITLDHQLSFHLALHDDDRLAEALGQLDEAPGH